MVSNTLAFSTLNANVPEFVPGQPFVLPSKPAEMADTTAAMEFSSYATPVLSSSAPELEGNWQEVKKRVKDRTPKKHQVRIFIYFLAWTSSLLWFSYYSSVHIHAKANCWKKYRKKVLTTLLFSSQLQNLILLISFQIKIVCVFIFWLDGLWLVVICTVLIGCCRRMLRLRRRRNSTSCLTKNSLNQQEEERTPSPSGQSNSKSAARWR